MNNVLDVALDYIRRGWNPVPIPFKKKTPLDRDWQNRIIDESTAPRFFNGGTQNIGIQLGPASRGLTDLDLDCAEAVAIAPYILPPTGAIFGRATKRASHWLYITDLSVESHTAAVQFKAPAGPMLVELRIGGGGKAAQTVFPGSTHESGETITWDKDGGPAAVDGKDLARRAKMLAAASLIARAWPPQGGRHNAARIVGGLLARAGMTEGNAEYLVGAIARAAGDSEWADRAQAARDAVKHSSAGGNTPGLPQLADIVGTPAARKIADWLGYRHTEQRLDNEEKPRNAPRDGGVTLDHFYSYMPMHRYIFVPTREMWPAVSVNARLPPRPLFDKAGVPVLNKKGEQVLEPANKWLDRNRPVEQMTWAPGLPMIVHDRLISEGGWIEHEGVHCFNLYRPPMISPGNASGAGPWLDHVHKVFPEDGDHIIKFLAYGVQHPQDKINHALVLVGKQGIGKDTLLEPVKRAAGPWNVAEVSPQQILGRFNGFLKSVFLRVSEARDLGEYDRFVFYEHMKTYTAAPPDVLRVDEKNLREYSVLNCASVIITTNNRIDSIYLPADDRRHFVAASPLTKEDFDDGYWRSIWGWYVSGGDRDVASYLLQLDITSFDPKAPPPKTAAFWAIVDANSAPEDAELADVLDRIGNPNAITLTRVQNAADGDFGEWIRDRKNRRAIPHRMETRGYVPLRNPAAEDGLWKVRGRRQGHLRQKHHASRGSSQGSRGSHRKHGGCFGQ